MAYDLARKRPYQPSLAAYFYRHVLHQDETDTPRSPDIRQGTYSATRALREINVNTSPRLPSQVQASLLSVGMRVRKAVNDGYRVSDGTMAGRKYEKAAAFNHIGQSGFDSSTRPEIPHDPSRDKENQGHRGKRKLEDSDGGYFTTSEEDQGQENRSHDTMEMVSVPSSQPIENRVIAKAKPRLSDLHTNHNRSNGEVMEVSDFEEAEFLRDQDESIMPF